MYCSCPRDMEKLADWSEARPGLCCGAWMPWLQHTPKTAAEHVGSSSLVLVMRAPLYPCLYPGLQQEILMWASCFVSGSYMNRVVSFQETAQMTKLGESEEWLCSACCVWLRGLCNAAPPGVPITDRNRKVIYTILSLQCELWQTAFEKTPRRV